MEDFNTTVYQVDIIETYRTLYQIAAESSSQVHMELSMFCDLTQVTC
jgi:hypothetical protein